MEELKKDDKKFQSSSKVDKGQGLDRDFGTSRMIKKN